MNRDDLLSILSRIDGRGYKAYKDIRGEYDFPGFRLYIDYVQGDPFASPSRLRVRVPQQQAGFPPSLYSTPVRQTATADFLARSVKEQLSRRVEGRRGTGKSGLIIIDAGGQEILPRTAVVINDRWVEARISLGLPARGRTVLGRQAAVMLTEKLPAVIKSALYYSALDQKAVFSHVEGAEDQEYLRSQLTELGLVAFVGNGAVLPRKSGVSDLPLTGDKVVKFVSPPELEVAINLPNHGVVRGMGIPAGVTLIVGGGYHGKSTLLRALERGIYNHIPGDGRELVVTLDSAVKIRAEDGRRVEKVDISPFINNLPFGQDTRSFSTGEASGSTSQAANIMEALEMGTFLLLVDEDTSATNFMIRDKRMQELVAKEKEPITPFVDHVRSLAGRGISTVIVIGGSGDYLDTADTVIMMDNYRPLVVTAAAREVARRFPTGRSIEGFGQFPLPTGRVIDPRSLDPSRGRKDKIAARGTRAIQYGWNEIDLTAVEQLVDDSQSRAIGEIIRCLAEYAGGASTLKEIIDQVYTRIADRGLDIISPFYGQHPGDYALPRPLETAAAVNRLRALQIK